MTCVCWCSITEKSFIPNKVLMAVAYYLTKQVDNDSFRFRFISSKDTVSELVKHVKQQPCSLPELNFESQLVPYHTWQRKQKMSTMSRVHRDVGHLKLLTRILIDITSSYCRQSTMRPLRRMLSAVPFCTYDVIIGPKNSANNQITAQAPHRSSPTASPRVF